MNTLFADEQPTGYAVDGPPSLLLLLAIIVAGVLAAGLFKLGVIEWVLQRAGELVRWGVRTGFLTWERVLAWAPWPLFAGIVCVLLLFGWGLSALVPLAGAAVAVVPLLMGLVATLAYMFIDVERYEVARGYKALHNPMKGQRLATELIQHGPAVGVPLLASAAAGMVCGFALLNLCLVLHIGPGWYTQPGYDPSWLDYIAGTVANLLSVVDLFKLLDSSRLAHIVFPMPESGIAKGMLTGFKLFFSLVLLQQIFASVRRGKLLAETVADFWSPHEAIHDRARFALPQYGAGVLGPILVSLRAAESLTREQRTQLPEILAGIGPAAIPHLATRLTDPNEYVRAVAVTTLGKLRAVPEVPRMVRLAPDSSELVRQGLAEALGGLCGRGWPPAAEADPGRWWKRLWRKGDPLATGGNPVAEVVPTLRALLADSSSGVRAAAAAALGKLGPDPASAAVPDLIDRLADGDESVRREAVAALGLVGANDPDTVPALAGMLTDASAALRAAAAAGLGSMGEAAAPAAARLVPLLRDRDPAVQAAASDAMNKIGSLCADATQSLADGLTSDDIQARERTAEALGEIGAAAAGMAPQLAKAATDRNDRVRAKAVEALGKMGEAAAGVAVPRLVRALRDPDGWVSALAAEALGEMGEGAADAALPALMKSLMHRNPQVRANAAAAVGKLGPAARRAIPPLEKVIEDADAGVRVAAVIALGAMGKPTPATRRLVRAALADPDPKLREAAAAAFGAWGVAGEKTQEELFKLLADPTDDVKVKAAEVLPKLASDPHAAAAALATLLASDDSDRVKAEAARGLAALGSAAIPAGAVLLRAAQTGNAAVRVEAMRAMTMAQPPEAHEAFAVGLRDSAAAVRKLASAGWRQAEHIPEAAVPALLEALHDPELQVRANVAFAVSRLDPVPAEAVPSLAECLASPDVGLRMNAALALAAVPGRAAADAIRPLLTDPNPRLRLIAARRDLAEDPADAQAAAVVRAAAADPNPTIRKAAEELLAQQAT